MTPFDQLTDRQRQCLRGVADYLTYKQIARDLGITVSAVEKHLRTARERLGVSSTAEAARLYSLAEAEGDPQSGYLNLHTNPSQLQGSDVLHRVKPEQVAPVEDDTIGVSVADRPLTALQTLALIGKVSLASIVGLLILIACAEGLDAVFS